jgi:hypothetical protein
MQYPDYQEIRELGDFIESHRIKIKIRENDHLFEDQNFKSLIIHIDDQEFSLYVYDAHNDIDESEKLLCVDLTLKALENYEQCEDYLEWCRSYGKNASDEKARQYHMSLSKIITDIRLIIGHKKSVLSPNDFDLNKGAVSFLRQLKSRTK